MTDTEYNRTSPFISNSLHYFSKIYPYVGEFHYLWLRPRLRRLGNAKENELFLGAALAFHYLCKPLWPCRAEWTALPSA